MKRKYSKKILHRKSIVNTTAVFIILTFLTFSLNFIFQKNVQAYNDYNLPVPSLDTSPISPIINLLPTIKSFCNQCGCGENCYPTCKPNPTITSAPTVIPTIPTQTPIITERPTLTPDPTLTLTPAPTNTPTPGNNQSSDGGSSGGGTGGSNIEQPLVAGLLVASIPSFGGNDFNPLIFGIKSTKGKILGKAKKLPRTADNDNQQYPSDNKLLNDHYLYLPKLNFYQSVYQAEQIGDEFLIGSQQILQINNPSNNNIVIYGHNNPALFGNLHHMSIGDPIYYLNNNQTFSYRVNSVARVSSTYTQVLTNTDNKQITLITCDLYDPNLRVVIKGKLIN